MTLTHECLRSRLRLVGPQAKDHRHRPWVAEGGTLDSDDRPNYALQLAKRPHRRAHVRAWVWRFATERER
jgi:hypothetical protein